MWHGHPQTYDGIFAAAPTTIRGQPTVLSVDSKVILLLFVGLSVLCDKSMFCG